MARSLDTGYAYYANLKTVIAVDDDNSTVKEFVNGNTFAASGTPTVSSGTWGSASAGYVQTSTSNTLTLTPNTFILRGGGNTTIFWAFEDLVSGQDSQRNVCGDYDIAGIGLYANNGTTNLRWTARAASNQTGTTNNIETDTGTDHEVQGKNSLAVVFTSTPGGTAYLQAQGSAVSEVGLVSRTSQTTATEQSLTYWGQEDDADAGATSSLIPSPTVKTYAFVVFDTALDSTAIGNLHSDWPTLLFGGGTSVAPLAMSAYSRMRNG